MALRIVNTVPGTSTAPLVPGGPVLAGIRTDTGTIEAGTVRVSMGFTGIINRDVLPEEDSINLRNGAVVALETTERRRPAVDDASIVMDGESLLITRATGDPKGKGIYELRMPIETGASTLGYFKFRVRSDWDQFTPDWCPETDMVCPYFGLEHGTFNTACYVFLRKAVANGSMIVGGPIQALGQDRPFQVEESAFHWGTLPSDSQIEVWIFYNVAGYPDPYSPAEVPIVEVWARRVGVDENPIMYLRTTVGSLWEFPTPDTFMPNSRPGPSNYATLFFGNAGAAGDILRLDSWAIYPDFRKAVEAGSPLPDHTVLFTTDSPAIYVATDGVTPDESIPSRWFPLTLPGAVDPETSMYKRPGVTKAPLYTKIVKPEPGLVTSGLERIEPRIATCVDGFMAEAFMAGKPAPDFNGRVLDTGFAIQDGVHTYQVAMLDPTTYRTIGIVRQFGSTQDLTNYYVPEVGGVVTDVDWKSLKLVRLVVDRHRGEVSLHVDDTEIMAVTDTVFPPSRSADGKVLMGHLLGVEASNELDVASMLYLPRYKAWEGKDGDLPQAAAVPFSLVEDSDGSALDPPTPSIAGGELRIAKVDYNDTDTFRFYRMTPEDLADTQGFLLDFNAKVSNFLGKTGAQFATNSWTGVGVRFFFGNKSLTVGFFNTSINGRVIGVIPGETDSGLDPIEDVTQQTSLGRSFSYPVDWTESRRYRIVHRPFKSIDIWTDSLVGPPAISIPWRNDTDGFNLPLSLTLPSFEFGHLDPMTASVSTWKFVRWGVGNGYDFSVSQSYPNGLTGTYFGGRTDTLVEFDE